MRYKDPVSVSCNYSNEQNLSKTWIDTVGIFESSAEVEFSYDDRHILLKIVSSFTFLVFRTVIYKIFIEKCFKLL